MELILLIDPGKEGLLCVVEDSATLGPVTLHASDLEVGVARDEEEVVVDQLLPHLLIHAGERVVGASKVTLKVGKSLLHQVLHSNSLLLGDARGEAKSVNGATNPDPAGVHWSCGVNVALDLVDIHVAGVGRIRADSMVFLDQRVEDLGKVLVGVPVSSIDSTVLIIEFDGTGNSRSKGESRGGSLDGAQLVPDGFGHILGDQGVGRLDGWEIRHGDLSSGALADL